MRCPPAAATASAHHPTDHGVTPKPGLGGGAGMGPAIVRGHDLDVLVPPPPIAIVVLDARIGRVHMTVVVRQFVLPRPPRDLLRLAIGPPVAAQNLTGIEILLSDRATTLAGTVQDERERPIGDYTVVAFATDSAKWGYRTRFVRWARPDQNGKFLIKGLPPGAYKVVAVEYLEPGEETDPARLENWRTTGSSVTLDDGEARSIALRLLR